MHSLDLRLKQTVIGTDACMVTPLNSCTGVQSPCNDTGTPWRRAEQLQHCEYHIYGNMVEENVTTATRHTRPCRVDNPCQNYRQSKQQQVLFTHALNRVWCTCIMTKHPQAKLQSTSGTGRQLSLDERSYLLLAQTEGQLMYFTLNMPSKGSYMIL